jgi:hypothetical protein
MALMLPLIFYSGPYGHKIKFIIIIIIILTTS